MKKEKTAEYLFKAAALFSVVAVLLICIFLFASAIPTIAKIGPLNFLFGKKWKPSNNIFGILPMILRHRSLYTFRRTTWNFNGSIYGLFLPEKTL